MNWCALAIASQLSRVGARRARGASTIEWRRGYWAKPMDFGPFARASILQAVDELCHAGNTRPKGQNVVIPQWSGGDKDGLCVVKSENVENLSARLVKQVALVSGDGELEIMGMTVRAMEKVVSDGFITVADPKTSQDEYEGVKAMNLDKGYTPAALITNPMLQKGELENAALSRKYMRNRIWGLQSVLSDLEVGTRHNSFFTRQFCAGARQAALKKLRNSVPERSLVRPLRKKAGRNHSGQITIRHRGGGHKRAYRLIDFRRQDKDGVGATVAGIEYDPNRTARIALLNYSDGVKSYILAARGLVAGDEVAAGPEAEIRPGNALPLSSIPVGTTVHAIELRPGGGAQLARSAGSGAQLMRKEGKLAQLRLPSSEVRNVDIRCRATIGEVGFAERSNIKWRKAGQRRWLGWRPTVRGVAMNPVDHPHGGGEGRTSGGRHPVNPQGKAEGRTRRPKASDALIVRRRKAKK